MLHPSICLVFTNIVLNTNWFGVMGSEFGDKINTVFEPN
jgi:hypothetical protein